MDSAYYCCRCAPVRTTWVKAVPPYEVRSREVSKTIRQPGLKCLLRDIIYTGQHKLAAYHPTPRSVHARVSRQPKAVTSLSHLTTGLAPVLCPTVDTKAWGSTNYKRLLASQYYHRFGLCYISIGPGSRVPTPGRVWRGEMVPGPCFRHCERGWR